MDYKDYYEIMGVPREASQDDIKKAYRKLARKYHPDVSKVADAEERFKELGEAYEVLKDPEKREAYDQLGSNWQAGQDFRPPPGWQESAGSGGGGFEGFGGAAGGGSAHYSDFFEDLFGGGFSQRGGTSGFRGDFQADGQDQHARILIDIRDSYHGATRSLQLQMPEISDDGRVINRQRTLNVKIPKGIRAGQQIRLREQGGPALGGGRTGDLYLEVEFQADEHFRVEGRDVYLKLPVTPWEAALGAKVNVPVPSGSVDLTIPPNSARGRKLRLKGKGLPGKDPGDLLVVLDIVFPPADSDAAKKIYREMQDELSFEPRSGMRRS
jgi:curved DNA-binding protein